jgi:hypothetical protein
MFRGSSEVLPISVMRSSFSFNINTMSIVFLILSLLFFCDICDVAPSTKTRLVFEGAGDFLPPNWSGRNFHFGVREHAMHAILNGTVPLKMEPHFDQFLSLFRLILSSQSFCFSVFALGLSLCKIRPFGSGFLIFSDYARPAIRLSVYFSLSLHMSHIRLLCRTPPNNSLSVGFSSSQFSYQTTVHKMFFKKENCYSFHL